jgi:hypothetical protein
MLNFKFLGIVLAAIVMSVAGVDMYGSNHCREANGCKVGGWYPIFIRDGEFGQLDKLCRVIRQDKVSKVRIFYNPNTETVANHIYHMIHTCSEATTTSVNMIEINPAEHKINGQIVTVYFRTNLVR